MQRNSLRLFRCRKNMTKLHILFVILKQNSSYTKKAASFLRRGSLVLLFGVDLFKIQFFQYLFGNSIFMYHNIHRLVGYERLGGVPKSLVFA